MNYQGKQVIVVGLGVSGQACIDYFLAQDVLPRVVDTRAAPPASQQLDPRLEYHFGDLPLDWLLAADLIVVSPGVALYEPALLQAKAQGKEIIGEIELFCREVNRMPGKRIAAITGSNGKTTVTTLLGEIVKAAGIAVGVGGNIGQPALSLLQQKADVYVLELSSFQLESTSSLQASVATILNMTEDHMDRYPQGFSQYIAAKQRIYQQAQCAVYNVDDANTKPMRRQTPSERRVGLQQADYCLDPQQQWLIANGDKVLMVAEMQLSGLHNYFNALVALAMADELGIARAISLEVIKQFRGLAHRFELVWSQHGVQWINDSKATNVGSTQAALQSVVCNGHLHLLLGGDGKAADFTPLAPYLQRQNLTIYTFGQDRQVLSQLNPAQTVSVETMQQAMAIIADKVTTSDVVLLSPACASLDQFKNYIERGEIFTQLARELGA